MAKGKYHEWLTEDKLLLLQAWARNGFTDEQIATKIDVSTSTLYDWKKKYPEISEALKRGKEVVDTEVENALLKRALGYEYEEMTTERVWDAESESHMMAVTKRVIKHVAPDVTAAIFWLKNRKPKDWRDKKEIDMDAKVQNPFDGISTKDIKKLIGHE